MLYEEGGVLLSVGTFDQIDWCIEETDSVLGIKLISVLVSRLSSPTSAHIFLPKTNAQDQTIMDQTIRRPGRTLQAYCNEC